MEPGQPRTDRHTASTLDKEICDDIENIIKSINELQSQKQPENGSDFDYGADTDEMVRLRETYILAQELAEMLKADLELQPSKRVASKAMKRVSKSIHSRFARNSQEEQQIVAKSIGTATKQKEQASGQTRLRSLERP